MELAKTNDPIVAQIFTNIESSYTTEQIEACRKMVDNHQSKLSDSEYTFLVFCCLNKDALIQDFSKELIIPKLHGK